MSKFKNILIIILFTFICSNSFAEGKKLSDQDIKLYISCVETYMKGLVNTNISNDQIHTIHRNCKFIVMEMYNDNQSKK